MAIYELFSKRQKKLRGKVSDVYTYNVIPQEFRGQVIHIILDCLGDDGGFDSYAEGIYRLIHKNLCREYGKFSLDKNTYSDKKAICEFLLNSSNTEEAIDVIEMTFQFINTWVREPKYQSDAKPFISPDEAIDEINERFKEHGLGYQFEKEANEIIRVDSTYIHSEVVKPVLAVLHEKIYEGANEEFLKAHEHYRHGRNKECLVECLKAFESVMKAICDKQKWDYNRSDTAKKLIDICFKKNLIPNYMQTQFTSLRSLLESGIPTIRNKLGGHGQGSTPIQVSDTIAVCS